MRVTYASGCDNRVGPEHPLIRSQVRVRDSSDVFRDGPVGHVRSFGGGAAQPLLFNSVDRGDSHFEPTLQHGHRTNICTHIAAAKPRCSRTKGTHLDPVSVAIVPEMFRRFENCHFGGLRDTKFFRIGNGSRVPVPSCPYNVHVCPLD